MQLPGSELFLESLIDPLLTLNTVLADEFSTDNQRFEMLPIPVKGKMVAGHAGENEFFDLIRMHREFSFLISNLA